jgi:hypothetical protein
MCWPSRSRMLGAMITTLTTEARVLLAEFAALAAGLMAVGLSGLTG